MPGVGSARVHAGFLISYNSVASHVISKVRSQLTAHPDYSVIVTGWLHVPRVDPKVILHLIGHSLGGALASIAGLSLKVNYPEIMLKLYTFGMFHLFFFFLRGSWSKLNRYSAGQPRTGNSAYAELVERTLGISNIFRGMCSFRFVFG